MLLLKIILILSLPLYLTNLILITFRSPLKLSVFTLFYFYFIENDKNKFSNYFSNSNLSFPDINNPFYINYAVFHEQNFTTNTQYQTLFHKFEIISIFVFSIDIRNLFKLHNILRRLFQSSHDHIFKSGVYNLNNKIKNLIFEEKQKTWTKFIENLSTGNNSLSEIKNNLNKNFNPIFILIVKNVIVYTDEDKA